MKSIKHSRALVVLGLMRSVEVVALWGVALFVNIIGEKRAQAPVWCELFLDLIGTLDVVHVLVGVSLEHFSVSFCHFILVMMLSGENCLSVDFDSTRATWRTRYVPCHRLWNNSAPLAWLHGLPTLVVYYGYYVLAGAKLAEEVGYCIGLASRKKAGDRIKLHWLLVILAVGPL